MRDTQLASDSQRSRTVPDVLFVDEEGNPIEAGHENILYTDENGNEITEEIAISLLESGKYIDSRDFYQDTPVNNEAESQPSFYPSHASLPASAFGSLSKSTGIYQMQMEMLRKEQEELDDSQAKIFAQVQAEMREILKREEELAQIEADANRNTLESRIDNSNVSRYSDSTIHQSRYSQQTPTNAENDVKDGNESQYTTEIARQDSTSRFTELEYTTRYTEKTVIENIEPTGSTRYSDSSSHFSKSQSQRRLPQPPPKKSDSILDFNESYLGGKKKPESLNESSYFVQDESYGEHEDSYGGGSGVGLALGGAHNESLHRLSKTSLSSTLQDHQQYQGTAAGSTISGYNNQKDCTNCSTPFTGVDYHNLFDSTVNSMSNYRAESTAYTPPPAQPTQNQCQNRQAPCYTAQTSSGGYVVEKARQVGQLSGNQIIKCLDKIDLSQFEKYYEQVPNYNQQSDDYNENDDIYNDGLFKDELVDIDFGVIDAFTSALNAQINAEKNMADNKQQSNLQFPSHVLTSKYATFLDTQIFLSDTSGTEKQNNNSSNNKCNNGCNSGVGSTHNHPNENNQNGISYQLLSSLNELDQSTFNNTAMNNMNDDDDEDEDDDEYSRSNSCGSFGDCKSSQVGAGMGYGLRGGEANSRQSVVSSTNYNIINNNSNPQNSSFINNSHINESTNIDNNPNSSYIDLVKSKQSVSSSSNDIYNLKNLSIHNR